MSLTIRCLRSCFYQAQQCGPKASLKRAAPVQEMDVRGRAFRVCAGLSFTTYTDMAPSGALARQASDTESDTEEPGDEMEESSGGEEESTDEGEVRGGGCCRLFKPEPDRAASLKVRRG